ncbi:hypothetical protein BB560_005847 [Smittium megazygosporum]|uniref:Sm domain-containing protein n=3 Tax=Smittium megazygosporum TaxID=133381 RepID=A0A2T9YTV8_9FUNG|nr:hypothetical protein BB560_005847 [Smittium megazygosporum]
MESFDLKELRSKEVDFLVESLYKPARVHISDGRVFEGYFTCIDDQANLIISEAMEYSKDISRQVGLIMIPKKFIQKFELSEDDYI